MEMKTIEEEKVSIVKNIKVQVDDS